MSAFGAIKWARSAPVVRRADGRPDATAHHVLLVLATYADRDGRARPSAATLAQDAVMALDTVDAALCRLVEAGLIEAGESFGGSGSVVWTLRMDRLRDASRAEVLASRQDRARRLTADRVRRYRERSNGVGERDVTVSDTVTVEDVTVSDTVCNGVGERDVTVSDTVCNGATAVTTAGQDSRTAIELPLITAIELPAQPGAAKRVNGKRRRSYDYTPDFEAFWNAYGRRGDKHEAFTEWAEAIRRADPVLITSAVPAYVASTSGADLRYRKGAERWLKNDGWESLVVARGRPVNGHGAYRNPDQSAYYEDL